LEELLLRLSRKIGDHGLLVDAEDQMAVAGFLAKSSPLNKKRDLGVGSSARQRDGEGEDARGDWGG
jgi:hypothetical protein